MRQSASGGSLLAGLIAMWLVELFHCTDPQPAVVVAQPIAYPVRVGTAATLQVPDAPTHVATPALAAQTIGLLPTTSDCPRELTPEAITALLCTSSGRARLGALLLLCGFAPDEIASLKGGDVDRLTHAVRVGGASPRVVELPPAARAALESRGNDAGMPLLAGEGASAATAEDLALEIFYAAHDAGILRPGEVTPDTLRHTHIAFLVRQGIRFADLVKIVGRIAPERAAAYSNLATGTARRPLEQVDKVMAGIRQARQDANAYYALARSSEPFRRAIGQDGGATPCLSGGAALGFGAAGGSALRSFTCFIASSNLPSWLRACASLRCTSAYRTQDGSQRSAM